jgi:hypothetical protein
VGRLSPTGLQRLGFAEFAVPTFRERYFVRLKQYREAVAQPIALALDLAREVNAPRIADDFDEQPN